jgi:esterase
MGDLPIMPDSSTHAPIALYHRDLGGSGDPPIVLLHGMLGSSRNWQVAGKELAASRRVFALDMRNHGLSPHSPEMTYEAMVADVLAWLDGNGIGPAEFVGHSMGGKVAMILACRHPDRVARLVAVDIAPKGYHSPVYRREYAAMNAIDLTSLKSRAQAEAQMEPQVPEWSMRKFLTTNLERLDGGGFRWVINLPVLTASIAELERNPLAPGDRYLGPTLFVLGGKSRYVLPGDEAAIFGHFPAARIETIANSGHNPHVEAREAFVSAVTAPG